MKKLANRWDLFILAAAVVCAAVLAWSHFASSGGGRAIVEYGGATAVEIDLGEDGIYIVPGDLTVTLVVEDGSIRFEGSLCPDKVCEQFGRLKNAGEYAVCMPARVVVRVVK